RYPAPFASYQRIRQEQLAQQEAQVVPQPGRSRSQPAGVQEKTTAPRKLSWKEEQERVRLEAQINELEAQREQAVAAVNEAGGDYVRLQTLAGELANIDHQLESALARWMELEERAEGR